MNLRIFFFKNVIFNEECKFINSKIASISFQKTIFHKATILKNTSLNFYTYKVKDFEDCEFYETLTFDKVVFDENKSKILDLEFNNTKFKRLHIHGINFEKGLIFLKESHIEFLDIQGCKIKNLHIEAKVPFIHLYSNTKGIDKLIIKQNQLENLMIFNSVINSDFLLNDKQYKKNDEFKLNLLNFKESTFRGKVKIQFYDCIQDANFYNTKFEDLADFYRTKFYKVNFEKTDFKNIAVFSESEFYCDVNFKYTKFLATSIFKDTVITGKLNLRDTIFKDEANFLDIKLSKVESRETARIIKDSFEKQNNIIEANKYYALEMKEREKELSPKKDFFEWLVFKIHGLSSNHSQDWTLALFWIINLTFFYSYLNIQPNDKILVFKILFSSIAISVIACMTIKIPEENKERRWLTTISTTIVCYVFYGYLVETDWQLSEFSKNLNPFSIMRGDEPITLGTLIFKIIIAYLIYQLIISIRQNTRRK
ncbi:pentapeptide repeat-containing protein [Aliarcobacter butzleri]|nr:pentapeptide repeat-containing protein [Aliarcobacter butzleri]